MNYDCHGSSNDVATLLLTDPVINDRLREVLESDADSQPLMPDGGPVEGSPEDFTHRQFEDFLCEAAELGWTVELVYENGGYNWSVGGVEIFDAPQYDWERFEWSDQEDWRDAATEGGFVAARTVFQGEAPGDYDLGGESDAA